MNLLKGTRCYTIGAMENANGERWRDRVTESLGKLGITVFSPYKKPFIWQRPEDDAARAVLYKNREEGKLQEVHEFMKDVRADDLRLVDLSDFLIAEIKPNVPTFGSVEELTVGNLQQKVIFLFVEGGRQKCPLWILGMLKPKYIYNNVEEILEMLWKIDSGEKEIDSDRWKLLRHEFR
jgi:hypothetical protein